MVMKIYHSKFARSVRVIWACEELGLPYELAPVSIHGPKEGTVANIHPLGKIPALQDGDIEMCESLAILDYIFARYDGSLRPDPDSEDYPAYLQWYHFGEASLGPYITMAMGHKVLLPEQFRIESMAKWGKKEAHKCFDAMAEPLSKHDYLLPTGFSAADISCGYMILLAKFAKIFDGAPEPVVAWFDRIAARPAWQKATSV